MTPPAPAVVIVSGGSAISPFTTPEAGCSQGQAAGSSDTFLRAGLLGAGFDVFTTIGTPWTGAFPADHRLGDLTRDDMGGDGRVEKVLAGLADEASGLPKGSAADQVTHHYLAGPDGWNERQAGCSTTWR